LFTRRLPLFLLLLLSEIVIRRLSIFLFKRLAITFSADIPNLLVLLVDKSWVTSIS